MIRNFKLIADAHTPGFILGWYSNQRDEYINRKEASPAPVTSKISNRFISFEAPAFEAGLRSAVNPLLSQIPHRPFAYFMVDEAPTPTPAT